MSPAEVRFVEIMGGKVVTFNKFKNRYTGFPLVVMVSLGNILKHEKFSREVREGKYYLDFGNDIKRGIEIQGYQFHKDFVKESARHEYLSDRNWRIIYIEAADLYRSPSKVQMRVLEFIHK